MKSIEHVFVYGEIIRKLYTRRPVTNNAGIVPKPDHDHKMDEQNCDVEGLTDDDEYPQKPWCYCEQPSYGNMIVVTMNY